MHTYRIIIIITIVITFCSAGCTKQYETDSAKHLKKAKEILANASITSEDWRTAEYYLYKVDNRSSSYKEAKNILPEVRAKVNDLNNNKELEAQNKQTKKTSFAAGVTPSQRVEFAQTYENVLLSKGMDATVTARGKNKTTLKITHVLINRAIAYQMINDTNNTFVWSRAGFTTILFADGYGGEWSYSLK